MLRLPRQLLIGLAILFPFLAAHAEDTDQRSDKNPANRLPKWEFGMGAGLLSMPDYRGSDEQRTLLIPIPYFIYRGDVLKADRGGVRGRFFDSEKVDLELSMNGSPPVRSNKNTARSGMPDLDPSLEIGPQAIVRLIGNAKDTRRLDIRLPIRGVVTSGFQAEGWVFTPALNLSITPKNDWHIGAQIGAYYGNRRYHQFLYGVDTQYATSDRPAYTAKGGYGGWQVTGSLSRRYNKMWVGGFVRSSTVQGAVFEDSPLVRRRHNIYAGLGVAWVFSQSKEMVEATDDD